MSSSTESAICGKAGPDAAATLRIAERVGINWDRVLFKPADLRRGIKVELEHSRCGHGTRAKETDVTHGNLEMTARIAWAHLKEDFRYYDPKVGITTWEAKMEKTRAAATRARVKAKSRTAAQAKAQIKPKARTQTKPKARTPAKAK